jgi:integrase
LVFPTKNGAVRDQANIMRYHFKPLCRDLGINTRWHDLRHFAISTWIEQGFGIKAIQTFAGHASTKLTLDRYGHLFPTRDHHAGMDEVADRLLA